MLTYSFTNLGSESLYQHLYKCIKNDILQGVLAVGEKLPSKRSFAKNLGISIITVENAYAQLISEGYLYSIPKKVFSLQTAICKLVIAMIGGFLKSQPITYTLPPKILPTLLTFLATRPI